MKFIGLTTLLLATLTFQVCEPIVKRTSRELAEILAKEEAAEQAAKRAQQAAREAESARAASEISKAQQLEEQRLREMQEVDKLSNEIREAEARTEGEEKQQAAAAYEEVEGHLTALKLERNTDADVEEMAEELEPSIRETCRANLRGFTRGMACFYLKTYAKTGQAPTDEEIEDQLANRVSNLCVPKPRMPVWWRRGKALRGLLEDIEAAPNNTRRFEIAAVDYACDLR